MKVLINAILTTVLALAMLSHTGYGQGTSTNNYNGLGPQGPYTLGTGGAPIGIGGAARYSPLFYANLSLGTNASGLATNQVMAGTTNVFSPTKTAFVCSDFEYVGFQLTAQVSNSCPAYNQPIVLAFSDDGSNFDSVVDPVIILANVGQTNQAGHCS